MIDAYTSWEWSTLRDEITKLVVLPLAKPETAETTPVSRQVFASDSATRSPDSDDAARNGVSPVREDSIAFFDQLRSNHHLHRHAKLHRTSLSYPHIMTLVE